MVRPNIMQIQSDWFRGFRRPRAGVLVSWLPTHRVPGAAGGSRNHRRARRRAPCSAKWPLDAAPGSVPASELRLSKLAVRRTSDQRPGAELDGVHSGGGADRSALTRELRTPRSAVHRPGSVPGSGDQSATETRPYAKRCGTARAWADRRSARLHLPTSGPLSPVGPGGRGRGDNPPATGAHLPAIS